MAITEVKKNVNLDTVKIEFICPVCKAKKSLDVPNSVIAEAKQLTTMSIARGLVCDHQFQAFVDKQLQVRGYQRVDFEFDSISNQEKVLNQKEKKQEDKELYKNLVLEGDFLEFKPQIKKKNLNSWVQNKRIQLQKKELDLKEIYEEFWEFIDESNDKFKDFIDNDSRRNKTLLNYEVIA
ncbi:MAG: hypothetical protein ACFFEY_17705 [Candidatus Thorarchaeota archaeon]